MPLGESRTKAAPRRDATGRLQPVASPTSKPGALVILLALLLLTWEPLVFAWRASAALSRVNHYGAPAVTLLLFRAVTIGVGIAAGKALLAGERHGVSLGQAFLGLSAVGAVWTYATPYFPTLAAPGDAWRRLLLVLAYDAAWSIYLARSRRVRASFDS